MSRKKIAIKLGISASTVSRTIKKYDKFQTVSHLKGNGRHSVITSEVKDQILEERERNPFITLRKISSAVEKNQEKKNWTCGDTELF